MRDAFARSVLWGFTPAAETGGRVLVGLQVPSCGLGQAASLSAGHAEGTSSSLDPQKLSDLIAFAEGAVVPQNARALEPRA